MGYRFFNVNTQTSPRRWYDSDLTVHNNDMKQMEHNNVPLISLNSIKAWLVILILLSQLPVFGVHSVTIVNITLFMSIVSRCYINVLHHLINKMNKLNSFQG